MSRFRTEMVLFSCLVLAPNLSAGGGSPAEENKKSAAAKKTVRTDRYGDPLPEGAIARLGTIRFRTGGQVGAAAYSPDGRLLAASDYGRTICVWQSSSGKERFRFQLRPDSTPRIPDIKFSPDSKILAAIDGSVDDRIRLWDMTTGEERVGLSLPRDERMGSITFSPTGECLAAICGTVNEEYKPRLRMWRVKTGKEIAGFESPQQNVYSLAFAPSGKSLAIGLDGEIRVLDAASGRILRTLRGHQGRVVVVAFSADGTLASTTGGGTVVRFWDPTTGREKQVLRGHEATAYTLAMSADGKRLLTSGSLHGIRVWDVASGELIRTFHKPMSLGGRNPALSPDGKTAAVVSGFAVTRWDVATGTEVAVGPAHAAPIVFAFFTPDRRVVTCDWGSGEVFVWDATAGRQLIHVQKEEEIHQLALSPDGRTAAGGLRNGAIRLWDLSTGKETGKLASNVGSNLCLSFSPDSKTLAAGYGGSEKEPVCTLILWDLASGKPIHRIKTAGVTLRSIVFSPDGKTLVSLGGGIRWWDVAKAEEIEEYRMEHGDSWAYDVVRFSPDGTLLATTCNGSGFTVRDCVTRRLIGHFDLTGERTRSVAFSPDGRLLACGRDDGSVEFWEVLTWKIAGRWQGPPGRVYGLGFSADGRLLVSGHQDTTALIWDVPALWASPAIASTQAQLDALWTRLGTDQPADAWRVIAALSQIPNKSVPLLRDRVRPVSGQDKDRVRQLLADLNADTFAVRENATRELEKRGHDLAPALRETLTGRPSPEVKRRVETLLGNLGRKLMTTDERRSLRAIAVLEQIGTPEARRLLRMLGQGTAESRLTREAKATLERLSSRSAKAP